MRGMAQNLTTILNPGSALVVSHSPKGLWAERPAGTGFSVSIKTSASLKAVFFNQKNEPKIYKNTGVGGGNREGIILLSDNLHLFFRALLFFKMVSPFP